MHVIKSLLAALVGAGLLAAGAAMGFAGGPTSDAGSLVGARQRSSASPTALVADTPRSANHRRSAPTRPDPCNHGAGLAYHALQRRTDYQ